MAHIFSLAAPAPSAYHEGNRSGDQVKFPDSGFFQGFNKPSRLEADIFELETTGTVSRPVYVQNSRLSRADTKRHQRHLLPHTTRPSLSTIIRGRHSFQWGRLSLCLLLRKWPCRLQTTIRTHRSLQSRDKSPEVVTWEI
jgi:hypothetical protein